MALRVNVCENGHVEAIQQLTSIKQSQQAFDVIVTVNDKEFHAHRNVLCAQSDYFNALLTHGSEESQLGKVEMTNVDPECVKICIDFIYTGKAEIPDGKIEQLIDVAHLMKLEKLVLAIFTKIEESLDVHTFFIAGRIAESYGVESLSAKCRRYLKENIWAISSQTSFQDEKMRFVEKTLSSENVSLTENEKLVFSLRWVGKHLTKKDDLIALLKCIKLQEVAPDYLRHLLDNDPLVENDFTLYKIFSTVLLDKFEVSSQKIDINSESKYILLLDCDSDLFRYFCPITDEVKIYEGECISENQDVSVICLDSYLYVFCEYQEVFRRKFLDRNAAWEKMEDMFDNHGYPPPVISLHNSLFVIGSSTSWDGNPTAVEKFIPSKNRWVEMVDRPLAVHKASLVSSGDFIYSLGGGTSSNVSDSFLRFNPDFNEWTQLEPMPQARKSGSAVSVEHKLYIMGGSTCDTDCYTVDYYDICTKQWSSLSRMSGVCNLVNAYQVNGWIFAVERYTDSCNIAKYDVEKDEWRKVEVRGKTAFKLCDSILV